MMDSFDDVLECWETQRKSQRLTRMCVLVLIFGIFGLSNNCGRWMMCQVDSRWWDWDLHPCVGTSQPLYRLPILDRLCSVSLDSRGSVIQGPEGEQ